MIGCSRLPLVLSGHRAFVLTALLVLLAMLAVGLVGIWLWPRDDSLRRVQRDGVLTIGYAVEAPYAFLTREGNVTGESPEVARVIAGRLGVKKIRWRLANFGSLLDELETGTIDVIAAGMAVTAERKQRVAFGPVTIRARPAMLIRKGNPLGLSSYGDVVESRTARVVVVGGSIEERGLRQAGVPTERLLVAPDALAARRAVETGEADVLALTAPTLRWMMIREPSERLELREVPATAQMPEMHAAHVFRRRDVALCSAWSEEVRRFLGTPEQLKLLRDFGFSATDLPLPSTP